ncbi:hypothetical protein [Marinobacterium jannaschii]|uniref:hypothetical protein n=1 Tax=Marinobacterium jannaschii TaxID=64970 RepID=UPI000481695C|nr:hypothetical protein [Marinobacterium jannaschii]
MQFFISPNNLYHLQDVLFSLVSIFLFGLIAYSDSGFSGNYFCFLWSQYLGGGQLEMGPLWFIAQLLV